MAYSGAVVGPLTRIDDEALNPLGTRRIEQDGKEYIYLQGAASVVATDWVTYDEAFLAARLAAAAVGPVAVALAAVVANKFGWFQIAGAVSANSVDDNADNGKVFATASGGRTDDTAVAGDQVINAIYRSVAASNVATVQLSYPFIGVTDTDS